MPEVRKLVTVLFADIVGSTELVSKHDPEVVRNTLGRTFDELRQILNAHGGTVEKFIGDAVMAVFGVPVSHDDDALRALLAAFALCDSVAELTGQQGPLKLQLRVGVNTGEVVSGDGGTSELLVTGVTVNVAARLQQAAAPGEILVGPITYKSTSGRVAYGEERSLVLKGVGATSAWSAKSLLATTLVPASGPRRPPLIGRDEELRLVLDAYERTSAHAKPHVVTIFGAAGAGKSRLAQEFIARIGVSRVRRGRCLAYGESVTLDPIRVIIREDAGILPTDDLASARVKLSDAVAKAFPGSPDDVVDVLALLEVLAGLARADQSLRDIEPADVGQELARGLRRFLERRASAGPLVLIFDDVHWAGPPLLDLIDQLAEFTRAPLFLLCLARPEFLDTRPGWTGGRVNATTVVLEPLTPSEARRMISELLSTEPPDEAVYTEIVARAEGNPLYVEEFVRLFIETRQLASRGGPWTSAGIEPLPVPDSLRGLIAARIDRAPPDMRQLLQQAAVIGRRFSTTGLAALTDEVRRSETLLNGALRRDIILESDEGGVGGGRVYSFKHVLIQEVAYASLPKRQRSQAHDRYARWLEETAGDRRDEFAELVGYHAEQAYVFARELRLPETRELAQRAFDWLMVAATHARVRGDVRATLVLYRRAKAAGTVSQVAPDEMLEVDAHTAVAGYRAEATPAALRELDVVLERARAAGSVKLVLELLGSRHEHYATREQRDAARAELRAIGLATGEPEEVVRTMILRVSETSTFDDDLVHLHDALSYAEDHGLRKQRIQCLHQISSRERMIGRFMEAQRHMADWEDLVSSNPTKQERANLADQKAWAAVDVQNFEAALSPAAESLALWRDLGNFRSAGWALGLVADVQRLLGHHQEALALAEERLREVEARDTRSNMRIDAHASYASVLLALNRFEEARAPAERAVVLMTERAVRWPHIFVPRALVHWANGETEYADLLFRQALKMSQERGSIEAPIQFDYARFLMTCSRRREAHDLLLRLRTRLNDPHAAVLRALCDAQIATCERVSN